LLHSWEQKTYKNEKYGPLCGWSSAFEWKYSILPVKPLREAMLYLAWRPELGEAIHKVSIQSFKTDDQNKWYYSLINTLELGKYVKQYHVPLKASK
jgi:hypothetical protein